MLHQRAPEAECAKHADLLPSLERWFATKKLPNEKVMRRVREILLAADPRVSDYIKYGSLLLGHEGDLVSFVQVTKKNVNRMFNNGAKIPGKFPHLEGNGPNARFMRFADIAEVNARAGELTRIARAWCDLTAPR
ncbi:MAG: hypothetical protein AUG06_00265 [Actinobacteria bacterium 13_1_20CM_2_65_11]|nr:MAG: hypothetical protein AUG06_00265 [Actinobacteria bacterium 13_1_20CM_2_65_11]